MKKVLQLERTGGYRDRAALGGLESFVAQRLDGTQAARALVGYDGMSVEQRAARVAEALAALDPASATLQTLHPVTPPLPPVRPHPGGPQFGSEQGSTALSAPEPAHRSGGDEPYAPIAPPSASAPVPRRRAATKRASASDGEPAPRARGPVGAGLDTPVSRLKGIGPSNARRLERLGIERVRDLLFHFPARHVDYSKLSKVAELRVGDVTTVVVSVWDVGTFQTRTGFQRIEAVTGDETGNLLAVWFRRRDYFASKLRGQQVVLSGRVESRNGRLYLNDPEMELLDQADLVSTARWVPVYPLTEGINARWMRGQIRAALEFYAPMLEEHLPDRVRQTHNLVTLGEAVRQIHFPDDDQALARARRRLGFDELFVIQLGVAQRKHAWSEESGAPSLALPLELDAALRGSLPFSLTGAQERVVRQILGDVARRQPMARLLQGDVGAGKTVVAAMAMLAAAASGYQSLLMAPTEILAEQHHRTVSRVLGSPALRAAFESLSGRPGPEVALLTGSTPKAQRRPILQSVADGSIDVLLGTHALIQESVEVHRLGLGVVDEQHRFGVLQRSALRQKGESPHLLVMTATPIPRTLAMTVYGELDVSTIDELPPGRQQIKTRWLGPHQRRGAYEFLRREVQAGRQAFVVCPLVEESETVAAKAATVEYERLRSEVFPELRLGLLHGRMSSAEKDEVMAEVRDGEIQVLVATVVIEVGIDVPNATVMLIEGADRFGLAQLHQLRGRVGRGAEQSYCMLLSEAPSLDGQERLRVIEETNDGFALAEEDLRIRGPGEFLGTRQSGLPELKVASLGDYGLIQEAREAAFALVSEDPLLIQPEHLGLAARVHALSARATDLA